MLVTATVLAAGLAPPTVAVKARLAGETDSAGGGGGSTVSVTGIVFGEPVAPAAVTVMSSCTSPPPGRVIDGVAVIVPAFVPLVGDTLSHARARPTPSSPSTRRRCWTPTSVLAAGLAPPAVALKDRLAGVTDSDGGVGGSTVRVTGIVFGEPSRPSR